MNGFIEASGSWLPWLATVAWQTAALALIACGLLRLAGQRLSPRAHYAVWGIVVLRLALPPLPELSIGLSPALAPREAVEVEATAHEGPERSGAPRARARARIRGRNAVASSNDLKDHQPGPEANLDSESDVADGVAPVETQTGPRVIHATAPPVVTRDGPGPARWRGGALMLWGAIALVAAIRTTYRDLRFRHALARSRLASRRLDDRIADAASHLGIRRRIEGVVTPLVRSPALYGIMRPKVLVPTHLLDTLDDTELSHVLLHELAHARKHDVLTNQALVLLRALHWFNPFAHAALARFEAAREAVRDREVLASRDAPAPAAYGHTLLRLLETCHERNPAASTVGAVRSSSDMTWRITMISRFAHRRPLAPILGAACVVLLGGAALVGASARPVDLPGVAPHGDTAGPDEIKVVRERAVPEWEQAIRKKLAQTVDLKFQETEIADVVKFLRLQYGLNIVVQEDVLGEFADEEFNFEAREIELGVALRSLLRKIDASYALLDGILYIDRHDETWVTERRIYNVDPLIGEGDEACDRLQHLRDLLDSVFSRAWEHETTYTRAWNGLLCISQTPEMHERIHEFMTRLLNDGKGDDKTPEWRTKLEKAVEQKISVEFGHDKNIQTMLEYLNEKTGLPFIVQLDDVEREYTLELNDVPLRTVLDWMGRQGDFRWEIADGGIVVSDRHRYRLGYYKLGSLLDPTGEDVEEEELRESLVDILRGAVNPASWEEEGALVVFWRDLVIVNQTEATHAGLQRFLAALRRARQ